MSPAISKMVGGSDEKQRKGRKWREGQRGEMEERQRGERQKGERQKEERQKEERQKGEIRKLIYDSSYEWTQPKVPSPINIGFYYHFHNL